MKKYQVTLVKGSCKETCLQHAEGCGFQISDEYQGVARSFSIEGGGDLTAFQSAAEVQAVEDEDQANRAACSPPALEAAKDFRMSNTQAQYGNWAMYQCTRSNPSTWPSNPSSTVNYQRPYQNTGKNVDIVSLDTGVDSSHPEWLSLDGSINRFQNVNWDTLTGITRGSIPDEDGMSHGTRSMSIMAGRYYGWAPDANIYSMQFNYTVGAGAASNLQALAQVAAFHTAKTNGNPTILQIGVQDAYVIADTTSCTGSYRGGGFSGQASTLASVGIISTYLGINAQNAAMMAAIEDCVDAGVIVVCAAGNFGYKCDIEGGHDYDNVVTASGVVSNAFYHRGNSFGSAPGAICVSAAKYNGMMGYTNRGPRTDVFAPTDCNAGDIGSPSDSSREYPLDNAYNTDNFSGTSCAAPNVAGVLACRVEQYRKMTPAQARRYVQKRMSKGIIPGATNSGSAYTDSDALLDAQDNYLYDITSNEVSYSITGSTNASMENFSFTVG